MARLVLLPSFLLCTLLLLISSTYPCGRYIEDRPLTSSFLYFIIFIGLGCVSVWMSKKLIFVTFCLHAFTALAAIALVYTTSNSCPYVFSSPSLSDISIEAVANKFSQYKDPTDVFFDPHGFTGGDFHFTDGEIVLDLMVTIEHNRNTPWRLAPIVPSVATWNRTRDMVPAWAVAPQVFIFPDGDKWWKDRSVHEGFLMFSDQWKNGPIQDFAREHSLKTLPIAPVLQWRDVDEVAHYATTYLVLINVIVYPLLLVICVGTWYYKRRYIDPFSDKRDGTTSYLLENLGSSDRQASSQESSKYGSV